MLNKYPLWKYILLVVILIVGIVYSLPVLYGEDAAVQISGQRGTQANQQVLQQVEADLKQSGLTYKSAEVEENNLILVRFLDTESQLKAQDLLNAKLGDNYSVALNLAPATPDWMGKIGANPMKLGLDLRGGVHFLLAVDVDSLIKSRMQGDMRTMSQDLRENNIRYSGLQVTKDGQLLLQFRDQQSMDQAKALLAKQFPTYQVLTNSDGSRYVLTAQMSPQAITDARNYAVNQTMMVLRKRVDELGIAEPIVQRQGASRISVDLPGIQDTARAREILGGTATLEFHLVDQKNDPRTAAAGNVPFGSLLYKYNGAPILLQKRIILSGSSITGASSGFDQFGKAAVNIRLGGGGESLFSRTTAQNVGHAMAIVYVETKIDDKMVNGKLVQVPHKSERIINVATIESALGNNFQITGLQDPQEARNLALLLRAGALPTPMSIIEESTVGPSLGKANIHKGIMSVVIGFLAIVVFVALYYSIFGLIANIALFANLVLLVAVLSLLGATLTLPGIAGIVLTLGMAVDANVLIFERIREELRNGMSPQAAIHAGYEKAFSTIVDANVTTLIVALILFALGTGAVKGFAVTLTVGLLISMLTSIMGTRALVNLFYGQRAIDTLPVGINTKNVSRKQKG